MTDTNSNRPISPEAVAAKLAAVRNFEYPQITEELAAEPRLVEMLLHLQFVSLPENYAGGLRKFTADLIADSRDLIGTAQMRALGERKLTGALAKVIYDGLHANAKRQVGGHDDGDALSDLMDFRREEWDASEGRFVDRFHPSSVARRNRKDAERREREASLERLLAGAAWPLFHGVCLHNAGEDLSTYFRHLCELSNVGFRRIEAFNEFEHSSGAPWYFVDVATAVLRWIDRRKGEIAATIAETEVTRNVFKWLGKARSTSRAVMISGNSRFGKTESLRTWCAMNPGLARLVNTPASNSEGELLREVAKALGLEIGQNGSAARLRDRIDYVLSNSRLMLVFDESHLIFPVNFSRNTAPARLNWVRRSVMDAGLPCAFCSTPQSYNSAQKRYVKTTGYAIEQFTGRLLKTVELPEELSREDLLAVARIHFPKLAEPYLQYVVEKTVVTERNYVSDLEKIATLARDNAQECGRRLPTLADIKSAIADVLPPITRAAPAPDAVSAAHGEETEAPILRPSRTARAGGVKPPSTASSRSVQLGLRVKNSPTFDGSRINFGAENPADVIQADGD